MFTEDSRTENFLTRLGVKWEYSNGIAYSRLAAGWEVQNIGRSRAQVEDAIIEYAERMEGGSAAPAPILHVEGECLRVLDGVQRLAAARLLGTTILSSYVVTTDSIAMSRTIRIMANHVLNGGHGESVQWTKRQAISWLVVDLGMSCEEVARIGGWKLADVQSEKVILDWALCVQKAGGPEDLSRGILQHLATHAKMDEVQQAPKPFAELCHILKAGKFTNGDAQPIIADVLSGLQPKKGIHQQLDARVKALRDDPEIKTRLEGRPTSRRDPGVKLRASLKAALTIADEIEASGVVVFNAEEYYQILNKIRAKVQGIASAGSKCRRK